MRKRLFLYFFGIVFVLGLLFFSSNHAVAEVGDIVFEVPLVPIDFLESWNYKIAQQYQPIVDQTVCSAEHSISTGDRSLTNSLVLSVYLSDDGPTPRPETGTKIAEVSTLNSFLRTPSPTYVSMEFEPCLNGHFLFLDFNGLTTISLSRLILERIGLKLCQACCWSFLVQ